MKDVCYRIIKRGFDLIASLVALILTSPLWLIFAVGIKLSSPGPVFYTSVRAGRNHKPIPVRKFRSMHVFQPDGSGRKREAGYLVNEARIFPLGKLMRKSKLDELPQMLCVLLGQMSFVGPRPYSEKTNQRVYPGYADEILSVRPGLAGLDSLFDYAHGELFVKDNQEYQEKVLPVRSELARLYVERRSIGLDLYCMLRTVVLIFQIMVLKKRNFPYTAWEREAGYRVENGTAAENTAGNTGAQAARAENTAGNTGA